MLVQIQVPLPKGSFLAHYLAVLLLQCCFCLVRTSKAGRQSIQPICVEASSGQVCTLYNVFSYSSTRLWFLSRLLIELRKTRTPSDRLFRRVAEISQGCSSNAGAAVLLDAPRIRMAMEPDALPSTINWMTFSAQPPSVLQYQRRTANDSSQFSASCSYMHIGCWSRSRDVNSAFSKLQPFHEQSIPQSTPGHPGSRAGSS